ncbi:Spermatid-specific linker histone H1-like protein [Galemys pyrenaicus]|uniref:Spermatid-specific linker histone H1-like protein n=1 Tax=Galemys pyrenaicus TaxID=202257 RepID=A0A8J6ACW6_GALPY|nr:Spermatid-specific linker histone H1-like protein [Galemys pyrenaicus]
MQKDTLLPPPPAPLASNTALGAGSQATMSGVPSKSETEHPKIHRKPSISKVILRAVEDAGTRHHVSLATLKKAVASTGYNMTQNAWRFKLVLKRLVEKGMLKQVTGKGALGSFRMGKNHASKRKLKAKRERLRQRSRLLQHGQRRPGQRKLLLGSRQGQKRLFKGARRAAKSRRN